MSFRRVAQFREMSIEYVSPSGDSTAKFFTDMPGNQLALRVTGTLPQSNADHTPRTTTIPLVDGNGAPLEGTLYYPRVEPYVTSGSGGTQLRSGVVYMRAIGVYLDGTLGEFFETLPIGIGT
jgi:hypothetical protein